MSYILEALRKSERERSLGKVPTLQATTQSAARRTPVWWLLPLVLLAAAAAWWFWQDRMAASDDRAAIHRILPSESSSQHRQTEGVVEAAPREQANVSGGSSATNQPLPKITLNVISWSEDPARRFAMINQKIVREGEALSDSINIRLIRPDQVIVLANGRELILNP